MSASTDIYDRIVKMEMQRALDEEQYSNLLARQKLVNEANIKRTQVQQDAQTTRQRIVTGGSTLKNQSDNLRLLATNQMEEITKQKEDIIQAKIDEEKIKQARDEALLRNHVDVMKELNDFTLNNKQVYPSIEGSGKNKRYYLPAGANGIKREISERQYHFYLENNDRITDVSDLIMNGFEYSKSKIRGKKVGSLGKSQLESLKRRTGKGNFTKNENGELVDGDGRTIGEISSSWSNRLTNDSLPIGSTSNESSYPPPTDYAQDAKPQDIKQPKNLKDLNNKKGGTKAGANQGVNSGRSFRDSVKEVINMRNAYKGFGGRGS